jgi:flagellar biosynthesis/type III secretory pathway chaperone
MSENALLDDTGTLQQADTLVEQLADLLDREFEALKVQDLDQFEILLNGKNQLLSELTRLTGVSQLERFPYPHARLSRHAPAQ